MYHAALLTDCGRFLGTISKRWHLRVPQRFICTRQWGQGTIGILREFASINGLLQQLRPSAQGRPLRRELFPAIRRGEVLADNVP